MKNGCLIVVSGPSGAGKGTICSEFLKMHPEVSYSVSATTRKSREGEVNGINYYFVDVNEFERMISDGELLEWAKVYGNYYGTPVKKIREKLSEGRDILLEIDTQGALEVHAKFPDGIFVFILPPSLAELERRIRTRGADSEEVIERRMKSAATEISTAEQYSYLIKNDVVEKSAAELSAILMAERCRTARRLDMIKSVH